MHGLSDGLACGTISANATVMFANVMIGSSNGTTLSMHSSSLAAWGLLGGRHATGAQ